MSYSTPFTAVAGTMWKAADWNSYGRDNIAWIATDSPACRAYHNADFGYANNTFTSQILNSERFDNAGMHSTSVNTERFTAPPGGGGKYLLGGCLKWQANATGTRILQPIVNGTTYIDGDTTLGTAGVAAITQVATVYAFSAADYVQIQGYQDSGGGLNVLANGNISPEFWMFWFRT